MLTVALTIISYILGIKEGILYSRKGADAFPGNEHVLFTIERLFVGLIAVAGILDCYWMGWAVVAAELISWTYTFSFVHNEAYHACRARIEGIKYVFGYKSPTTTAKVDFNGQQRLTLLIIGGLYLAAVTLIEPAKYQWYFNGAFIIISGVVWLITKTKVFSRRSKVTTTPTA